jgi:hypothetical protein
MLQSLDDQREIIPFADNVQAARISANHGVGEVNKELQKLEVCNTSTYISCPPTNLARFHQGVCFPEDPHPGAVAP